VSTIEKFQEAIISLDDSLAMYLIKAIRNPSLFKGLLPVFRTLLIQETPKTGEFKTHFFDQLSTMCALEMSMQEGEQPSLDHIFVEGILSFATIPPFVSGSMDQPLLTFLKQDVVG
jgi:hypothetical protein